MCNVLVQARQEIFNNILLISFSPLFDIIIITDSLTGRELGRIV